MNTKKTSKRKFYRKNFQAVKARLARLKEEHGGKLPCPITIHLGDPVTSRLV